MVAILCNAIRTGDPHVDETDIQARGQCRYLHAGFRADVALCSKPLRRFPRSR